MSYKTSEVADQLEISRKSLLRVARKLEIPKDANGYYVYTELDIEKIADYLAFPKKKVFSDILDKSPIQQQIDSLELRLKDAESLIDRKADDIASYQLLQHRQELEELHKKIAHIEEKISRIEDQFSHYEAIAAAEDSPNKKKNFFKSILGLEEQ